MLDSSNDKYEVIPEDGSAEERKEWMLNEWEFKSSCSLVPVKHLGRECGWWTVNLPGLIIPGSCAKTLNSACIE